MAELPRGYRFYPTEEELIAFYLHRQLQYRHSNINRAIPLVDIYKLEPWDLPKHCGELCRGDTEQWFFFMPKQERQVRGAKPSRTTASGYWKATGSPSHVYSSDCKVIAMKKSMVFYKGKAPTGTKTKWKMHEYHAIKPDLETSTPRLRDEVSLCRIYVVSGSLQAFDRRPVHIPQTRMIIDRAASMDEPTAAKFYEENLAASSELPERSLSDAGDGEDAAELSSMIDEWLPNFDGM